MGLPLEKDLCSALSQSRTRALCVLSGRANMGSLYRLSSLKGSAVYLGDKLASGLGRSPGWVPVCLHACSGKF